MKQKYQAAREEFGLTRRVIGGRDPLVLLLSSLGLIGLRLRSRWRRVWFGSVLAQHVHQRLGVVGRWLRLLGWRARRAGGFVLAHGLASGVRMHQISKGYRHQALKI
ncbi:MAG: hypothetical protein ACKOCJ_01035 [Burkholderiaceae bacterium]